MFLSGLVKYSEAVLTFFWLFIGSGQIVSARPFSSSAGIVRLIYLFTLLFGQPYVMISIFLSESSPFKKYLQNAGLLQMLV